MITADLERLRDFYSTMLRTAPTKARADYVEFGSEGGAALSLYRQQDLAEYAPGATEPRLNRSVMIEFLVDDVDAEYDRLKQLGVVVVKPPSTQPWGNRSLYLRDPDGNLVNLYARQ